MSNKDFYFGDIVLVKFPFSDGSSSKARTAVVMYQDRDDCLVVKMTSNLSHQNDITLTIVPDRENGLRETTVIEISKQFLIHKSLITAQIGTLGQNEKLGLKQKLHEFIDKASGLA